MDKTVTVEDWRLWWESAKRLAYAPFPDGVQAWLAQGDLFAKASAQLPKEQGAPAGKAYDVARLSLDLVEGCAQICENEAAYGVGDYHDACKQCARAIRQAFYLERCQDVPPT